MFATYLRLHLHVHADWRVVIRAAAHKLTPQARRDPAQRDARRHYYRKMLAHHTNARDVMRACRP